MQEETSTEESDEPDTQASEDTGSDEESREEEERDDAEGSGDDDAEASGDDDDDGDGDDDEKTDIEKQKEEAREEVAALEDDPPKNLSDWPTGKAKYETLGGADSESGYDDAATVNLGPSDVRHYEDGTVKVGGEEVDNPEDYKGEPIPGGPTDPNTPAGSGEQDLSEKSSSVDTSDRDDSDDEGSDDSEGSEDSESSEDSEGSADEEKQEQES